MATKKSQRRIKEWGGVPGRKDSQVFAGGLGAHPLPLVDGVDVDIYLASLDDNVAGQHGSKQRFAVEITVEQDKDLEPDLRTFNNEEEAVLYARKYVDFLMKVLNNS